MKKGCGYLGAQWEGRVAPFILLVWWDGGSVEDEDEGEGEEFDDDVETESDKDSPQLLD